MDWSIILWSYLWTHHMFCILCLFHPLKTKYTNSSTKERILSVRYCAIQYSTYGCGRWERRVSTYFTRAKSVLIAVELWDTSHIATMLQWINRVGNLTVINKQLCSLVRWGTGLHNNSHIFHFLSVISVVYIKKIRRSCPVLRSWGILRCKVPANIILNSHVQNFLLFIPPIELNQVLTLSKFFLKII